jgi:hypothetical protein
MKPFPLSRYLRLVRAFQQIFTEGSGTGGSEELRQTSIPVFKKLAAETKAYSLLSTSDQLERMSLKLEGEGPDPGFDSLIPDLLNRLEDDSQRLWVMMLDPDHIKYIRNSQFFDSNDQQAEQVSTQFPSAAEDIAEAGKCFALERSTACVMHLSRVMESGLKALAKALGIQRQNDWGKYLTEIDNELTKRFKASGARTAEEQFFAEVHITFDAVRRAWRNPTMHVDKTRTMERAEEIMISVRSFMRHLATILSD